MEEKQQSIDARIEAEKRAMVAAYGAGRLPEAIAAMSRMYSLIRARNREMPPCAAPR